MRYPKMMPMSITPSFMIVLLAGTDARWWKDPDRNTESG
jgi:hypothetical protein